jgi:LmbE family N-acetylglucosaminyl deacetylase
MTGLSRGSCDGRHGGWRHDGDAEISWVRRVYEIPGDSLLNGFTNATQRRHYQLGAAMKLVAIGAHPDDIELGCAALIKKVSELHLAEVYLIVLTDDGKAKTRRREALNGARSMGVPRRRVLFAGMRDGQLRVSGRSVERLRNIASDWGIVPDVIITHTEADSHNDHVEACRIAHAAFRQCVFLHFSIHLSAELDRFEPRLFIDLAQDSLESKAAAIACHGSQENRLKGVDLTIHEQRLGNSAGLKRVEAFEVRLPGQNHTTSAKELLALSDSPFHKFWLPIMPAEPITIFHEGYSQPGAAIDWPTGHENVGREALRQAFNDRWLPRSPLRERASDEADVMASLNADSIVLVGGAVGNIAVRNIYNRMHGTVWAIDYDVPRTEPAYLLNRETGVRHYPRFADSNSIQRDYGVVSRVTNPFSPRRKIVCAAGATGFATRIALELLAEVSPTGLVARHFDGGKDTQMAFAVEGEGKHIEVLDVHYGR